MNNPIPSIQNHFFCPSLSIWYKCGIHIFYLTMQIILIQYFIFFFNLTRMASTVMQVYLKELMEAFFHENSQVRLTALNVITLVLKQGLVHPVQVRNEC